MWQNLTVLSHQAIAHAEEAARARNGNQLDSLCLLSGVIRTGYDQLWEREASSLVAALLVENAVDARSMHDYVLSLLRIRPQAPAELALTHDAETVLELAAGCATTFAHKHIGPEHLLLACLKLEGCGAYRVLDEFGMDYEGGLKQFWDIIKGYRTAVAQPLEPRFSFRGFPWSDPAADIMEMSRHEAARRGSGCIGLAHILMSFLKYDAQSSSPILPLFGIAAPNLYETLAKKAVSNRELSAVSRKYSDGARCFLQQCVNEAHGQAEGLVEPHHILLGITGSIVVQQYWWTKYRRLLRACDPNDDLAEQELRANGLTYGVVRTKLDEMSRARIRDITETIDRQNMSQGTGK